MDKYGHNIRKDVRKQETEISNLPILCETCLGDNPYVRLLREERGKECKICNNPFTHFRWKAGQKGRYKQTIICPMCAKVKNSCQTCLFDLEYHLPIQVRDKFIENAIILPENETNRNYFLEKMENDINLPSLYNTDMNFDLKKLKRYDPYFKRNLPRVCSFWKKNSCNRGNECPYLHKEIHTDKSLYNQNIKNRYLGENDILAEKILKKYDMNNKDKTLTNNTICIHGIITSNNQLNIKECFKKFGEIKSLKMIPSDHKLYINYKNPDSAIKAYEEYKQNGLQLNGNNLTVTLYDEIQNQTQLDTKEHLNNIQMNINNMQNIFTPYNFKNTLSNNYPYPYPYPSMIPYEAEKRRK